MESARNALQQYIIMAGGLLSNLQSAEAAVVYTDVDPDFELTSGDFPIDFNGDETPEFTVNVLNFITGSLGYNRAYVVGSGSSGNAVVTPVDFKAAAINPGVSIGSSAPWNSFAYGQLGGLFLYGYGSSFSEGLWAGKQDGFVGLKIQYGSNIHFGWIRLDVSEDYGEIVVKDYAYETLPDAPVKAGATGTPCLPPVDLAHQIIGPTAVRLHWKSTVSTLRFQIEGEETATGLGGRLSLSDTIAQVHLLNPGSGYTWTVRALCLDGTVSDFATDEHFVMPAFRRRQLLRTEVDPK